MLLGINFTSLDIHIRTLGYKLKLTSRFHPDWTVFVNLHEIFEFDILYEDKRGRVHS